MKEEPIWNCIEQIIQKWIHACYLSCNKLNAFKWLLFICFNLFWFISSCFNKFVLLLLCYAFSFAFAFAFTQQLSNERKRKSTQLIHLYYIQFNSIQFNSIHICFLFYLSVQTFFLFFFILVKKGVFDELHCFWKWR